MEGDRLLAVNVRLLALDLQWAVFN